MSTDSTSSARRPADRLRRVLRRTIPLLIAVGAAATVAHAGADAGAAVTTTGATPTVGTAPTARAAGNPTLTNLPYGAAPEQRLDVLPSTATRATRPAGTILFVHGGAWVGGHRNDLTSSGQFNALLDLRDRGWSIVTMGYPLGAGRQLEQLWSVSGALDWVRTNGPRLGIDTRRVILAGHSAGGQLATLVALAANAPDSPFGRLSRPDGWIAIAAPADLTATDPITVGLRANAVAPGLDATAISPLRWVDPSDPAGYVIHGDQDAMVPVLGSIRLARATGSPLDLVGPGAPASCRNHLPMCGAEAETLAAWLEARSTAR